MDASYLEALQELDWRDVLSSQQPAGRGNLELFARPSAFDDLLRYLVDLHLDAIFIDAPTGFNDTANLCLRVLSDLVVAIFSPARVHLEGIGKVLSLLAKEQAVRMTHGRDPKPDVLAVASTILLPTLGGQAMKRVMEGFRFLEEARREAVAGVSDLRDQAQQEPASIGYDPLLAYSESSFLRAESASYGDIVRYLQGALPEKLTYSEPKLANKAPLLESLFPRFALFAEEDGGASDASSLFLRTRHVDEAQDDRVVLVLGGKGSGKTALFQFLTGGGATHGRAVPVHGPHAGIGQDLLGRIQEAAGSRMDVFWRLYALARADVDVTLDGPLKKAVEALRQSGNATETAKAVEEFLSSKDSALEVDAAWRSEDQRLASKNERLFLCLDGLDRAFKNDAARREAGVAALFVAWQATFSALKAVSLKVFLRNDLWERVVFPERSHLLGREMRLTWDGPNLWRMIVKRSLDSRAFAKWVRPYAGAMTLEAVESASEAELLPYLDRLFERHIWTGKKSLSRDWILRRLADAQEVIYPRDLVSLLREANEAEQRRVLEKQSTSEGAVLSRQSLSDALPPTSKQRVRAIEEEYPELQPALRALRGMPSSGDLSSLREGLAEADVKIVERVVEALRDAGVVRLDPEPPSYRVSELYRIGLEMVRFGPR
jgi:hypothetical protein